MTKEPGFAAGHRANPVAVRIDDTPFRAALLSAGRNRGPDLLWQWWRASRLTIDELRLALPATWRSAEVPERMLPQAAWLALFDKAGFVSDAELTPPDERQRLYRASTWHNRGGMSWTPEVPAAQRRAELLRHDRFDRAHVFAADVDPTAVLAVITGGSNGEPEVVVHPAQLKSIQRWASDE